MFTETKAMFLYCTSPVHVGAGTAVGGLIDNPIQRERHTGHPVFPGSGIKGAIRHAFHATENRQGGGRADGASTVVERIFGPETNAADFAGAISFTDAQLVAFPVRSPKSAFVYATCPIALARARRLLRHAGVDVDWKPEKALASGECRVVHDDVLSSVNGGERQLLVEAFSVQPVEPSENLQGAAAWLAGNALPESGPYEFFRDKLKRDLVLLSDDEFGYFVKNATVVEPHVRIDDTSGTASDGGLFYTENLPPESLMLGLVCASGERAPPGHRGNSEPMGAAEIMEIVRGGGSTGFSGIDGKTIQIGGDATTGRGLVDVRLVGGDAT